MLIKYVLIKSLLVAGTILDANSSWRVTRLPGYHEANPIFATNGRYATKGVALEVGITGGTLVFGAWRLRRHPEERRHIELMEAGQAAEKLVVAGHNYYLLEKR